MKLTLDTPLIQFPGVGEVKAKGLEKLGLRQCRHLLTHFPRKYEDWRTIWPVACAPLKERVCVRARISTLPNRTMLHSGVDVVKVWAEDRGVKLQLTFFHRGYLDRVLRIHQEYLFCGVIGEQRGVRTMVNPIFEVVGQKEVLGRIVPRYPLTAGISNYFMMAQIERAMTCIPQLEETLPQWIREEYHLKGVQQAYQTIHQPESFEELEQAKGRFAFEETFVFSVGLALLHHRRKGSLGITIKPQSLEDFFPRLPFSPTQAQRKVMEEIRLDLQSGRPMNRLIQGDVGSGKTAVAAFAAWMVIQSGWQVGFMAPTEVLAEQHRQTMTAMLEPAGIQVGLLTSSVTGRKRRELLERIGRGEVQLVVGTQALLSQGVDFHRLALLVADEQHRFGVAQRATLAAKAEESLGQGGVRVIPHVLVMSATPIPRTLSLMIYGDLELSILDQLPPGRKPVKTHLVGEEKREGMYHFLEEQMEEGRQIYVICPAVEETDQEDGPGLRGVTACGRDLEKRFPQHTVGILHGRLGTKAKEKLMAAFVAGEIQLLVSTTVIEVGVDVPNASVMVVENAERFGLSQLHQLRGRVGRGNQCSYCFLMTQARGTQGERRLQLLASTTDGFKIAEEDLKLRGPGDFFGERQHGLPSLSSVHLTQTIEPLHHSQQAAQTLLQRDEQLSQPEHQMVLRQVQKLFADTPEIFN